MDPKHIVRTWKDPEYRTEHASASGDLPDHPAGALETADLDDDVNGGTTWWCLSIETIVATLAMNCTASQTYCRGTCDAGGSSGCCS